MVNINEKGYLIRKEKICSKKYPRRNHNIYDWFPVRASKVDCGYVNIDRHHMSIPKEYVGKRIKIRIEILDLHSETSTEKK